MAENLVEIDIVAGRLQAEILRGLLEAQGFHPLLSKEGAGEATGLVMGPLGEVKILVPASEADGAKQLVEDYYGHRLEGGESDQ
jgi:hypothetical protein